MTGSNSFRSQTTKGIWLARCADIEPCTLVMDLEGTDGRERGEVPLQALYIEVHLPFSFFFSLDAYVGVRTLMLKQ